MLLSITRPLVQTVQQGHVQTNLQVLYINVKICRTLSKYIFESFDVWCIILHYIYNLHSCANSFDLFSFFLFFNVLSIPLKYKFIWRISRLLEIYLFHYYFQTMHITCIVQNFSTCIPLQCYFVNLSDFKLFLGVV